MCCCIGGCGEPSPRLLEALQTCLHGLVDRVRSEGWRVVLDQPLDHLSLHMNSPGSIARMCRLAHDANLFGYVH